MQSIWSDDGIFKVHLDGVWTVSSVSEQIPWITRQSHLISEQALRFSELHPGVRITTEIDLDGVTALDDSGRRLLVIWLGHLEHRGFNPVVRQTIAESCWNIDWKPLI